MTRVLGLDIGGSGSRMRLVADGVVVADRAAGSASLTAAGPARAGAVLDELLAGLPELGAPVDAVCAGAAGSRTAQQTGAFLRARLAPLAVSGNVLVVDDASLILPAYGLGEGIAVICGTGSIATGSRRGREAWAGGWGYLLGDEGSGYWIVRSAIRALLSRREHGLPPGDLGARMLRASGAADLDMLRAEFYRRPEPGNWARHAPGVLDSADPEVSRIVTEAGEALASLAADVCGQLAADVGGQLAAAAGAQGPAPGGEATGQGPAPGGEATGEGLAPDGEATAGPLPVVLAGGLMAHQRLRAATVNAIEVALPGSPVHVLRDPPVAGAVRLAEAAARSR